MSFVTKWIKTGRVHDFVFLGKETIATASGNHVLFYNLDTKEERIEYFNSPDRGDGACCLASHTWIPLFSTVERCRVPRIFIHTYPDLGRVAVCKLKEDFNSYISCCFSGTEYLLSLTSVPKFQLIVWLWRSGEMMGRIDTTLTDDVQTIESTMNSPYLIYQFASTMGKLLTYEIYVYSKKAIIIKNNVQFTKNKIVCVSWTNSSTLLLCDEYRNVYIVNGDGKKFQQILASDDHQVAIVKPILILPYYSGFLMVKDDSKLTCYNKSFTDNNTMETYTPTWSIKCESHPLKISLIRGKDSALLHCENGKIYDFNLSSNVKFNPVEILNNCRKFKFMCSVKPEESSIVLVDDLNHFKVIDIYTGQILDTISNVNQEDNVLCLVSHPHLSLIAVSTSLGKCECLVFFRKKLKILYRIHLLKQPLSKLKFSKNGSILGTASTESQYIFLMQVDTKKGISVSFNFKLEESIVDFLMYDDDEKSIILTVLIRTDPNLDIGSRIKVFFIDKWENSFSKNYDVYMDDCYQNLHYGIDNKCDIISVPYVTKKIYFFKFEDNYKALVMIDGILSEHKLRNFDINTSSVSFISSGYDGLIIIRNNSILSKIESSMMVLHCFEGGAKCTIASICGQLLVSLGKNGSLVGIFIETNESRTNNKKTIKNVKESYFWENMNEERCVPSNDLTWLEQEEIRIKQEESDKTKSTKNRLSKDFESLKIKVKQLLDQNELKSKEARLDVSSFDLSASKRKEKIDAETCKQETENKRTQERINCMEKVVSYMMVKFWNALENLADSLIAFNSNIQVDNYPLYKENILKQLEDDYLIELYCVPLSNTLAISSNLNEKNKTVLQKDSSVDSCTDLDECLFLKYSSDLVFTGSTSFKWINDDDDCKSNQLFTDILDNDDHQPNSKENELKKNFNEKFNRVKGLKKDVLENTKHRLKRLNVCMDELQNVFGIKKQECEYHDIKWHAIENSENVITITEHDITPELFMSEVDGEIQNGSNVVQDKTCHIFLKNLSLFRKKKLEEMMDGVLEIRWEDELKQEVPKPSCLLDKNLSDYTKSDIEAIKIYEERVEKLESERKKYRSMLENEIQELNDSIRNEIKEFDAKMESLALEKIKINSAVLQEFLLKMKSKKRRILKTLESKNQIQSADESEQLTEYDVTPVEQMVSELKLKYEALCKRDKALEGKFKNEFSEVSQPLVEHLTRQYKRRPKIVQISCASLTFLVESTKCLLTGQKSLILPEEYLDCLRGMDALDLMPSSLPPQIDSTLWQSLCKLRRNKLDMEIKVRVAALELNEAEQTLINLQKFNSTVQSQIYNTKSTAEEETTRKARSVGNPDIQLVLKIVQTEIRTSGHPDDFENSTIVTYDYLRQVNGEILHAGHKKISALRSLMNLRNFMLFKNWEYKCMFKKIERSKEHLCTVQKTKVSKEMLKDLRKQTCKKNRHRDASFYDKMLKSVRKKFERMLDEEKTGLLRLIIEVKHWSKMNSELLTRLELLLTRKQEQSLILTDDSLRKMNKDFHKNQLHRVMERNRLVESVKKSRNELVSLQNQLELLRLKTYPTLRFKTRNSAKLWL